MFVLYEEDGAFKAGTILADNEATLQVENTHGKRVKLKRAHVLMEFREPGPADLLARADALLYRAKERGRNCVCTG